MTACDGIFIVQSRVVSRRLRGLRPLLLLLACAGAAPPLRAEALAQPAPPQMVLPSAPAFHFSDPEADREYYRLQQDFLDRHKAFSAQADVARASATAARSAPPGGAPWARARHDVEAAMALRGPAHFATMRLVAFAGRFNENPRSPETEYASALRDMAQDADLTDANTVVELLAELAGISPKFR